MKPEHEESALNSHCLLAVNNDGIILETVTQRIFHSTLRHICSKSVPIRNTLTDGTDITSTLQRFLSKETADIFCYSQDRAQQTVCCLILFTYL